ncbi:alpha/beta fold hydrolase [Tepidamorphus sp. 3E244]|uniref:alpha/beta fold hydrolase n=1 Tax=Tepidamorphus sp. 3E244 TaxID=3385498 RepID=UPI0038FC9173
MSEENDDLADLFPGFDSAYVETGEARIFCRTGGEGPPLVLLHGYPQTHVCWHRIAPKLAEHFSLVIPDMRGYGWSSLPEAADDHETMSKRALARDVVALMEKLGHARFSIAGHDRGGRVAYRLALDHPGRVERIALLDIVPTLAQWESFGWRESIKTYHWPFLAQPYPLPETLIVPSAVAYLDMTLASWTGTKSLEAFDAAAMAHYRAGYDVPERIHAMCEDYRAGATYDMAADRKDREQGKRISVPLLAIWGESGIPAGGGDDALLNIWRQWAEDVRGHAIDSGHFLAEENPDATLDALMEFFSA